VQYNVAQLLREPIGATRDKHIDAEIMFLAEEVETVQPVTGKVRLLRTDAGVFVQGSVHTHVALRCSRCLEPTTLALEARVEEEFRASGQFATNSRECDETEDPALVMSEQHELDLREVVRQQLLLALPMHPVCRSNCAGLCPHCGQELNEGPCDCTEEPDPRWAVLEELQISGEFAEGVD
jgi:uncharacterized protein